MRSPENDKPMMTENNNNDDGWGSPDEDSTPRARTKPPVAAPGKKMEFEMEGFDTGNNGNNRGNGNGPNEAHGGGRGGGDRGFRGGGRQGGGGREQDWDDAGPAGGRSGRDDHGGRQDDRRGDNRSFRGGGGGGGERRNHDRPNNDRPNHDRPNNDRPNQERRGEREGGERRGGADWQVDGDRQRRPRNDDEDSGRGRGPPRDFENRRPRDGDDRRRDGGGQRDNRGGGEFRPREGGRDGDREDKPKRVDYIPPELDENNKETFKTVKTGKNFVKYESVDVKITGPGADSIRRLAQFSDANLNDMLMQHLSEAQYLVPTPIQKSAIPTIMNGKDIMACAQTGSGKTAAFLLPIINELVRAGVEGRAAECQLPNALIVAPTRELATQIYRECYKFCRGSEVKTQVLYGGVDVRYQRQKLAGGCNILIGTPGRINDFIEREFVGLSKISYFILDEADRMLDMGFGPIMEKLANDYEMPIVDKRQTLLFSATFPDQIQSFAAKFLRKEYLFIKVGIVGGACSDVTQRLIQVETAEAAKTHTLEDIVKNVGENNQRTLVFVETKRKADFIACMLSQTKIPTTSIHGGRLQPEREKALSDFKLGVCPILVATSVAARGLDIPMVEHVINYELPKEIEEYVHRIGRTGRCGNVGLSTSFYDSSKDAHLAGALVKTLAEANQEVPEWLSKAAEEAKLGGDGYQYRHSRESRDTRGDQHVRSPPMNNRRDMGPDRRGGAPKMEKTGGDSADENVWGNGEKEETGNKPASKPASRGQAPQRKTEQNSSDEGW